MVNNQIIHQESWTYNVHHLTSNPGLLLPKSVLWFQLSWGDLITIPLIMVMLRFTLKIFHLNLTLNLFQIQTPIGSNQLMMMKWTISCISSIQNMMMIFWMMTSIFFKLDWWSPLLQNFIQSLMCCFINMEDQMFLLQISCHTFPYLSQPRPLWNWLMETRDMPNELVFFYVVLLTVTLYIQWDQFIIFLVTLPKPSH